MTMMKKRNSNRPRNIWLCAMIASVVIWQVPGITQAAELGDYELDQMVVTATKTSVKQSEANANITVITRENIETRHYQSLSDALRDVPGVNMAVYGGGVGYERSTGLRINGSDKVVVLIDGVRVNIAGEKFQATAFNAMDHVERIEVLKGAASALYGSDAKGGVINIITRKVDAPQTTLTVTGGSFDQENYNFRHQGSEGDYSWIINSNKNMIGNYNDGKGTEIPQQLNADTNAFKLTKVINDKSSLTVNYDQYKADGNYYSFTNGTSQLNQKKYFTNDNYNWRVIHNQELSDSGKNQFSFYNSSFDETYSGSRTYIKTIGIQEQFTQQLDNKNLMTVGFDFSKDEVKTDYYDAEIFNRALYLQNEWNMNKQWNLTSGIRSDWHSGYDTSVTPKVTLGFKQNDHTNYYVSYNEFFIAPTPYQLYSDLYGNYNLKPEEGNQLELGVNHRLDSSTTAAFHIFRRDAKNVTGWVAADSTYHNFDEEAHGWDIQLNKKVSPQLSAYVGYTKTTVDPTQERRTNVDGYIPEGVWNIGIDYERERYSINVNGQGIYDRLGPQDSDAYAQYFPQTCYWVWNMAINYTVNKDITAFVKANNLFDTFYAEHSGATSRPGWGGAEEQWWTSPGRNFQIGMKYSF